MMKMYKLHKKIVLTTALFLILFFVQSAISQEKVQKIDEYVQKYYELGQFNGAVLVADGGNIIYSKGVGYADMDGKVLNQADTKFRLASVSKQFTATLIMQLVEQGKISLEGKLTDYLPYYRKDVGEKITISQILSHTSGLGNYTDNGEFMRNEAGKKVEPKEFVLKYCSDDLVFEPGSKWAYSNSGYFILGLVIEEMTGKKYDEVLQENIFGPLGMKNSGYEHSDRTYENMAKGYTNMFGEFKPARFLDMSIPYSAGSLYSTVEDMLIWDRALYTEKILKKSTLDLMFTPVKDYYGYGWQIIEQPLNNDIKVKVVTHSGGIFGFNSLETRLVEDDKFVMVLNNFEGGNINQLTLGIVNILYGLEPAKPKPSLASMLSKGIKDRGLETAIAEISALKDKKDEYRISEGEFNNLGYMFLQEKLTPEAVAVFKLNVEMFPNSSNVYDSYGEALAEAGDKENSVVNYRKSLELNPNNDNAKKMIEKLEGK
jgi:CubicO group peptidase (beta-lactamase class C family)